MNEMESAAKKHSTSKYNDTLTWLLLSLANGQICLQYFSKQVNCQSYNCLQCWMCIQQNEPCGCCWNCWTCCMLNCWFASRSGNVATWVLPAVEDFPAELSSFSGTNDERMLDISWNCFRDGVVIGVDAGIASVAGHSLYAAGFNIFSSKNCHCRCSDAMVGQMRRDVIFFIISARDLSPSEELQNQIGSTSGSNFAVPSARGFWKKKSVSGFKWRR